MKVHEVHEDHLSMGIDTHWPTADSVYEVVDAGFNHLCVEFMIRNYSYSAIAILRGLHECRYFCGVALNPKQQRTLVEAYYNECLKVCWVVSNYLSETTTEFTSASLDFLIPNGCKVSGVVI